MWVILSNMFRNSGFIPDGHSFLWNTNLVGTVVVTNALIGLSYLSISLSLGYLLYNVKTKFPWILGAFGLFFIAVSGIGHFIDIFNLWKPLYWESTGIQVITAIASVFIAGFIFRLTLALVGMTRSQFHREQEALKDEGILSYSPDLFLQLSNEGRIQYANTAAFEHFSIKDESIEDNSSNDNSIIGRLLSDLNLDSVVLEKISKAITKVMQGKAQCQERLFLVGSSESHYFDADFTPLVGKNRQIIGISIRLYNISEKVRHFNLLQASQERFQLLVEGVSDSSIFMMDANGRIQSWNEGARRLKGYSENEIINRHYSILFRPEDVAVGLPQSLLKRAEMENHCEGEGLRRRKDGSEFYASFVLTALREANGNLRGFSKVTRDISIRKKTEEDLKRAYAELERRVLERTAELQLSNQQLIEHRQAVIKAYSLKSEFLANMSHEIRTPLNAIVGMAAVGFNEEMSEDQKEVVSTIKTAADSLLLLVNDILDFSKIEAGKVDLEISDFRLSSLCRNAIEVVSPAALSKEIALSLKIDPQLPKDFAGDAGRILQILLNLMSNAIKFTPVKGTVEVRVKFVDASKKDLFQVRIEICDSGIGMSQEVIQRLFQPFSQADASTARKFGGTGLGLSISKRLTEIMGGKIGVESKSGEGSLFWLEVPFKQATREVPNEVPSEASSRIHPSNASNVRILVAEDNPANQKVMQRFLNKLGYKGTLVADGKEAVDAFIKSTYDIIFLDCQMPEMDGYEAARRIREIEQVSGRSRTALIALTAHAFASDRELTKKAGMDDYLSKPMSLKQLEKVMGFWLNDTKTVAPEYKKSTHLKSRVINSEKIKELEELNSKDQADIVCELIEYFFSYGTEKFLAVQKSLESMDMKNIEKDAHALKSICFNVGANNLTELCEQVETCGRAGDKKSLFLNKDKFGSKLKKEFEAASIELKALVVQRKEEFEISKA